jgi:hypothetical protein
MKTHTINGIPYSIHGTDVFYYQNPKDTTPRILIGSYNADDKSVTLFADWQERVKGRLEEYRNKLRIASEDAMKKARELQGVA